MNEVGGEFSYLYDFGDDWEHRLLLEDSANPEPDAGYPRCTGGARCGPPEDVGSLPGYLEYLAALADPAHEQHEDMVEWRGPFDPERFDLDSTNRTLAREVKLGRAHAKDR